MKGKICILISIMTLFFSISFVFAYEGNEEFTEEDCSTQMETYSINDPENNYDDGEALVTVTYVFDKGTYKGIYNDYYIASNPKNSLIAELDYELFVYKWYKVKHCVLENGYIWDFSNDIVTENTTLYVVWEHNRNSYITFPESNHQSTIEAHFEFVYPDSQSEMNHSVSTKDVTNYEPLNILYEYRYNDADELAVARNRNGIDHYGGCGPIAMIGILDYLAVAFDYNEIIQDANNQSDRIDLATDVYREVKTIAFGSEDDKNVGTAPMEYTNSFNDLMKQYYLQGQITANYCKRYVSKEVKLNQIKESIDAGIPVTCYTIFNTDGNIASHYFNIYGYEEWDVIYNNQTIKHTFIKVKPNNTDSKIYYIDADFLNSFNVGLIIYDINPCDNIKIITGEDFCRYFINDGGNYMIDTMYISIHNAEGYYFDVKRNNCASFDNKVVMMTNPMDNNEASLQLNFFQNIRTISFKFFLLEGDEIVPENTTVELRYYDEINDQWIISSTVNLHESDYYFIYEELGADINLFSIVLKCSDNNSPVGARIKIDNIIVGYITEEQHYHQYTYTYTTIKHTAICSCGDTYTETHTFKTSLVMGKLQKSCVTCGYIVDMNNDFVVASLPKDNQYQTKE